MQKKRKRRKKLTFTIHSLKTQFRHSLRNSMCTTLAFFSQFFCFLFILFIHIMSSCHIYFILHLPLLLLLLLAFRVHWRLLVFLTSAYGTPNKNFEFFARFFFSPIFFFVFYFFCSNWFPFIFHSCRWLFFRNVVFSSISV